jgi:hypothetical protein
LAFVPHDADEPGRQKIDLLSPPNKDRVMNKIKLMSSHASSIAIGAMLPKPSEPPTIERRNDAGDPLFEVKPGDRVGSFNLRPGWHTAREIAAMIPGASVIDKNTIKLGTRQAGPVDMHVLDVLEIIRHGRGSRAARRAAKHRKG